MFCIFCVTVLLWEKSFYRGNVYLKRVSCDAKIKVHCKGDFQKVIKVHLKELVIRNIFCDVIKVHLKEVVIIKIFCDVIKVQLKEVVIIKIFSWYDKSTLEKKLFRKINCDVIKVHCTMGHQVWLSQIWSIVYYIHFYR